MIYQLTDNQRAKFAAFDIDQPRLAQLVATVVDRYAMPPGEAWEFVLVDLDSFMQTREDEKYVREITKSCRRYGEYLDEMELLGAK